MVQKGDLFWLITIEGKKVYYRILSITAGQCYCEVSEILTKKGLPYVCSRYANKPSSFFGKKYLTKVTRGGE